LADDILQEAMEAFEQCESAEKDNRTDGLDDLKFARLGVQWPEKIRKQRQLEGRPCLTINKLPAFLRQVVNDSRQNKPGIAVHPVEKGDKETAEVIEGLIRNIEKTSNADVAYDTAVDNSATTGVGYIGVNLDYACDDTFEQDIVIKAKPNRFAIYGDPYSQCADSSDWMVAFEVEEMAEASFKRKYPKAEVSDFGSGSWQSGWCDTGTKKARVAAYWKRSEIMRELVQWTAGEFGGVNFKDDLKKIQGDYGSLTIGASRPVKSYSVKQYTITQMEVLSEIDWVGKYIPLIPVYGEEINEEGKRHFRSLIRDARDPQQMLNFWRTSSTELVALAPKAPFIGPKGAFKSDPRWATANNASHPFIEFDGSVAPQRQPFTGVPAGDLQMALNASDDMKAVLGIYDASLGARSNETSGVAINARQHEGDVSTFHFIDNLSRAIRHTGVVVIDLIQKVYTTDRIVRVLGIDGTAESVKITGDKGAHDPQSNIYNLTLGKYDLDVKAGGNYTTQRQQALDMLTELVRAEPQAAMILGDIIVELMDIPGGDKAVKRLQAMLPPQVRQAEDGDNPETQAMQAQMDQQHQQFQQILGQMQQQLQEATAKANDNSAKAATDSRKADIDAYRAVTDRIEAVAAAGNVPMMDPAAIRELVMTTLEEVVATANEIPGAPTPPPVPTLGQPAPTQPVPQVGQAQEPMPAQ
jgi:uncharacterized membrane protein